MILTPSSSSTMLQEEAGLLEEGPYLSFFSSTMLQEEAGLLEEEPDSSLFSSTMFQEEAGLLEEEPDLLFYSSRFQTTSRGEEENQGLSDPIFQVLLFEHC